MAGNGIFRIIILGYSLAIMVTRIYFLRPWVRIGKKRLNRQRWREFIRVQGWGFVTFSAFVGTWLFMALILYLLNLPSMAWTHIPRPDWIPGGGLILGIIVFPFHIWVHKTLGTAMKPTKNGTITTQLVIDGPYRYIRHPMFVTTAIVLIAMALMATDLLLGIGVGCMIALMIIWAPREEQQLLSQFGDHYRVYMQRTGRFIPKRRKRK